MESLEKSYQDPIQKKEYIAPIYKLETNMTFQYDALKTQGDAQYTCRQCSSCHGCR